MQKQDGERSPERNLALCRSSAGEQKTGFRRFSCNTLILNGGRYRDRTCDPCRVKAMLYR